MHVVMKYKKKKKKNADVIQMSHPYKWPVD